MIGVNSSVRAVRMSAGTALCCACLLYVLAAFAAAPGYYPLFLAKYAITVAALLPVLLPIVFLATGIAQRPEAPLAGARAAMRGTMLPGMAVVLVFLLCITAFTTLKFRIPALVPFYLDPALADLDEALHLAVPWQAAHAVAPSWAPEAIDILYSRIWFLQWFGMLAFVAFWNDRPRRLRYLWAFALTTAIVGTLLATFLSSVGPILYDDFYHGGRFSGLVAAMNASEDGRVMLGYASYLLDAYQASEPRFATGISAMPSVHVAIAVLNAWFLTSLNRWLGLCGWLFTAAIFFGSVFTGWHYAVDGYVSFAVVSLIWWASGRALAGEPLPTSPAVPAGR